MTTRKTDRLRIGDRLTVEVKTPPGEEHLLRVEGLDADTTPEDEERTDHGQRPPTR